MGLFNFINKNPTTTRFEIITDNGNGFYMWDGKLYNSDIIRSCTRPKVKALGKLSAKHIRSGSDGLNVNPDPYIRLLLEEPNPYMTGQMMIEKIANQLALNHNAFAYINRDENGYATDIFPIPCYSVEAIYDSQAFLWLKFTMKNGKTVSWPYSDIIHIREDFNDNEIFGTRPDVALRSLMEIVNTTDQGIVKAVKNSGVVKWLLKFQQSLRPEDMEKQTKDFVENYLSIDGESGGAAAADAKYDAKQVDPKDYVPNATQMDRSVTRVYNFFNTNEKIVQSKYNEDEWVSYFEAAIEPIAIQLSNEFTRKIFSRRERGFGNKIIFQVSNLQYASMSTKLQLVQFVDRGMMTPNEVREIMNYAPIEGGDVVIRRLDTVAIHNKFNNVRTKNIVNVKDKIYAVDFDGTLCKNMYPKIGNANTEIVEYVKNLKSNGNKIILWTCRSGELLEEAKLWCENNGIELDAINENLQETLDQYSEDSRKITADYYLDDKALNIKDI